MIPGIKNIRVNKVYTLVGGQMLQIHREDDRLFINMPLNHDFADEVIVMEYQGTLPDYSLSNPVTVSAQYADNRIDAVFAKTSGNATIKSFTYSHYFGDWKHTTCVTGLKDSTDAVKFNLYIDSPGDYQVQLDYQCGKESAMQQGCVIVDGKNFYFRILQTADFDKHAPMQFIRQMVATISVTGAGNYKIVIKPLQNGKDLFNLKALYILPVH
ncbi:hypothetical protein [Pedobacter sp. BS3]|uniref:hypothetical protein n=1 Tax=Pedobacter sp. BS3 TaxID=2567937 RepID=UPI0018D8A378|nr:hypothetical protein [Pedobacter sp. BS3]